MSVISIQSSAQFKKLMNALEQENMVLILKFYFTWCGYCQKIAQPFEQLAKTRKDLVFAEVDMDKVPTISDSFDVKSGPTFMAFRGKQHLGTSAGSDIPKLIALIEMASRS